MIRIGILDVSERCARDFETGENISAAVKERIEKTKHPKQKLQRRAAYALLEWMYKDMDSTEQMPEIIYTPQGKPSFFENNSFHFTISHSDGVVAVAISDGEVGIDVQSSSIDDGAKQRVGARFGDVLRATCERGVKEPLATISFFEIKNGAIGLKTESQAVIKLTKKEADTDFSASWTLLEAALKLDGGGFSSIGSISKIINSAEFLTVKFNAHGKQFALTVAEKCDKQ